MLPLTPNRHKTMIAVSGVVVRVFMLSSSGSGRRCCPGTVPGMSRNGSLGLTAIETLPPTAKEYYARQQVSRNFVLNAKSSIEINLNQVNSARRSFP